MGTSAQGFAFIVIVLLALCDIFTTRVVSFYPNERNELLRLRDGLNSSSGYLHLHANWTGVPCGKIDQSRWAGITCSNWHVVQVNLDGLQLTGSLPHNFLHNITYLTRLSLKGNYIFGSLPDLSGFKHLQRLILSQNQFSSSIPYGYIELPRLRILELEENYIDGSIPPFDQESLLVFNVSNNNLDGQIPQTGVLRRFAKSSFEKNSPSLCGSQLGKQCDPPPPPSYKASFQNGIGSGKKLPSWSVSLIAVTAALVPISAMSAFFCFYKKAHTKAVPQGRQSQGPIVPPAWEEKKASHFQGVDDTERTVELQFFDKGTPIFDLDDLLRASAVVLGKGNSGTTYKAMLETGSVVVVKRMNEVTGLSKKDYLQQMQMLGRMKHENLVKIISFYYSNDEKLVVSEFFSHGNLYDVSHGTGVEGRASLDWKSRLYIIKDIAKGLHFLHQNSPPYKVPHANLKSSNILIHHSNNTYQAKLTDFGFLPLFSSRKDSQKLAIGMCPEFSQFKKLTNNADVYCFGIVLLELITGRNPHDDETATARELIEWVRSVVNSDWSTDILDLEIVGAREGHDDMLKLTEIALECTDLNPERRPKMDQVLGRIEEIEIGR